MRIGIVNDLALAREALRRIIESQPGYSIAWMAEDGAQAVRLAVADRPDAILMDLIMPGLDGVEATRQIMARSPCPVLIVTSTVAGNYSLVCQAMGHGALDAVQTPELGRDGRLDNARDLLARLERLERTKQVQLRCALPSPAAFKTVTSEPALPPLVAIGASTGGPEALASILSHFPPRFPAPIVVVQHISAEFAPNLVTWLAGRLQLPVEAAVENAPPRPGVISVAVTNDHLILTPTRKFHYTADPLDDPYRPSVNAFFESLALAWPRPGVAALLTGMGQDGARGMGALRGAGWLTIAQDQGSCVVYGMPRAAVECNAACRVMPLSQIGPAIVTRLGCGSA